MDLSKNLGLNTNPFTKKSSEQEVDFINNIFFEPNYYRTLLNNLKEGDSALIIGQRGHGKSSIINKLYEDLYKDQNIIVLKVDRFEAIPLKENETALIKLIIEEVVTKLSLLLLKNQNLVKSLNIYQKQKLAILIKFFFKTLSNDEYQDIYNRAHKFKLKNNFKRLFNKYFIDIFNGATSTLINISSTSIRKSLGLNVIDEELVMKEYFQKFDLEIISSELLPPEMENKEKLKKILDDLFNILDSLEINRTIVLIDKIDEYSVLDQDTTKIANFIKEILSDTELLLNNKIAIGFSLWSELKSKLKGIVRFDKFGNIDVRWNDSDLIPLIDKRLAHFSSAHEIKFSDLIVHQNDSIEIIQLSNKSPRDLLTILFHIYLEQSNIESNVKFFRDTPIRKGMIKFCETYDYDSQYPSKVGKGKEIKAMVNRLLSMKLISFDRENLTKHFNQSDNQSIGQIKVMVSYNLIREEEILGVNKLKRYEIIDPKIKFLIKHQIHRIE